VTDRGAAHPVLSHAQHSLFVARNARSRRASSYDRSGANADYIEIGPGETAVLMQHDGPGCITHLYCGMVLPSLRDHRGAILRCFWDGSDRPSVEVPLGDFFGLAHGRVRTFSSRMLAVNDGCGSSHGLNAYFPMPFDEGAVITLENRQDGPFGGRRGAFWYHVDYETYPDALPDTIDRFHASYRQERPTTAVGDQPNVTLHGAVNDTGDDNYVALDTKGAGRMVGLLLEIDNVQGPRWYGEGDDMVFVDGEPWPPAIHGTGTEEIFGGGACPSVEYASLYTGYHLIESAAYDGLVGMYRWFEPDPIHFRESLRWTIEHGHADNFGNDYSSVAYWYQSPLAELPELPSHDELAPPLGEAYEAAFDTIGVAQALLPELSEPGSPKELLELCEAAAPFYAGRFDEAREAVEQLLASPGWKSRA
jgi:hypothetical protein